MNPDVTILTTCHPVDDVRVFEKVAWSFKQAGFAVNWVGPDWRLNGEAGEKLPGVSPRLFGKGRGILGRTLAVVRLFLKKVEEQKRNSSPGPPVSGGTAGCEKPGA